MSFVEYKDQRVVVTGCSSGVGLATATALIELGANVIGMSRREPQIGLASFFPVDLTDPTSIESAAGGVHGKIDALFNCAGAPPTLSSVDLVKTNFLGPRLLTEQLIDRMPEGAAIVNVSSSVASTWRTRVHLLRQFTACSSYQDGADWYATREAEAGHGYPFSKEALSVWTLELAVALVSKGIRVNATSPGAVQTPLMEVSERAFPAAMLAATEQPSNRRSSVIEQVQPLLFLNSPRASYVNGADLAVDGGHAALQYLDSPELQ